MERYGPILGDIGFGQNPNLPMNQQPYGGLGGANSGMQQLGGSNKGPAGSFQNPYPG
jgi:hypothetical protein